MTGSTPRATGASNMDFLEAPDLWPLDELDQDAELTRRALAFVREHPGRTLGLAIIKLGRYWSPWPNAEGFRSPLLAMGSLVTVVPLLALVFLGLWRLRRDPRAWVLLAGPLVLLLRLAHGVRQLDAVSDPRRSARDGAGRGRPEGTGREGRGVGGRALEEERDRNRGPPGA